MQLILHIGAGKTGTSSIQKTLLKNNELLKEKGVWYLGLMCERTKKLFDWQKQTTVIDFFYKLDQKQAEKEIEEVLNNAINEARKKNYHTLIWSNESLLGMKESFIPVLKRLQKKGIEVKILYYVREPISWAVSAYIQWGIKNKTYKGKNIIPFNEFIKIRKPLFYKHIEYIYKEMPNNLYIRNMNAANDVVKDFLTFIKLNAEEFEIIRVNEKPSNEELIFRAMFNSKFIGKILPNHFDNLIKNKMILANFENAPIDILNELMPNKKDLENLTEEIKEDILKINKLLERNEQPPLKLVIKEKELILNNEILIASLIDIVTVQAKEIQELRMEVNKIYNILNEKKEK